MELQFEDHKCHKPWYDGWSRARPPRGVGFVRKRRRGQEHGCGAGRGGAASGRAPGRHR
jgi:hypothetical protein